MHSSPLKSTAWYIFPFSTKRTCAICISAPHIRIWAICASRFANTAGAFCSPVGSIQESCVTSVVSISAKATSLSYVTFSINCSCVKLQCANKADLSSSNCSLRSEKPAAAAWPPNSVKYFWHACSSCCIWYPGMDLPDPFRWSPESVITYTGR